MSAVDDYAERRRLQAENELLRARKENERLKQEIEANEIVARFAAFLRGDIALLIDTGNGPGSFRVQMEQRKP